MRVWEEREEVKIHRGPVVKVEEHESPARNGQPAKQEVKNQSNSMLKGEEDVRSVGETLRLTDERHIKQSMVEFMMEDCSKEAAKVEELAPSEVVPAEDHRSVIVEAERLPHDEDEEWEEKVRRDIEGEAD